MGATGSTPTYYDFDMFQEMAVTTGGADAQNPTPGVQLNLVLKKGTNIFHGDGNIYFENEGLQGNNMDPTLAQRIGGSTADCAASGFTKHCGNRTDKYLDNGFDLGGPLLKDKIWVWGRIGRTDVQDPHAHRRAGRNDPEQLRVQSGRAGHREHEGELHVLRRQQDEERSRRIGVSSELRQRGSRPVRRGCTRARATGCSDRICSLPRAPAISLEDSTSRRSAG